MATHSQAERDDMTVEIAFAVVSALFLACVTGAALASPIFLLHLHGAAMRTMLVAAAACAIAVLLWRLARVLWHFDDRPRPGDK